MTLIPVPETLTEDEALLAFETMVAVKASKRAQMPGLLTLAQDVGRTQAAKAAVSILVNSKFVPEGMAGIMTTAVLEKAAQMFDGEEGSTTP